MGITTSASPSFPILSSLPMSKNDENPLDPQSVLVESRSFHLRRQFISYTIKSIAALSIGLVIGGEIDEASAALNNRLGGLPNKVRNICIILDELQRDLMQERWELVEGYPAQLRSYVPVFTTYTDAAFPADESKDKSIRAALRYEVGRFFAALELFRKASELRAFNKAALAYSDMAIHFDAYLQLGNLYTYDINDYSKLYKGVKIASLRFVDPKVGPAEVRDSIVLIKGSDKGKNGIVICVYDDNKNCVVKLDKYKSDYVIREIRIVPRKWVGKRLGEPDPDGVFLLPRTQI